MKVTDGRLSASPTDLANFVACRHKTRLDRLVARGELVRPTWRDPLADVLAARGIDHEARYVASLRASGKSVEDLKDVPVDQATARVLVAMRAGTDVIVQAPLEQDGWSGIADMLCRVDRMSTLGAWSYEVVDTKLSRETRGGTILQLCVYTEMLAALQGIVPAMFRVVTPEAEHAFRFDEYAAFYRLLKKDFLTFVTDSVDAREARGATYPDPVEHCEVCRWWERCTSERRRDDHLSFVAGLGRVQQTELEGRAVRTLAALAALPTPIPFVPSRGSKDTYERLRDQARLQAAQRISGTPTYDLLDVKPDTGLCRLPAPAPGDLFLDLEGDPFGRIADSGIGGGREYLFGLGKVLADGTFDYRAWWAFSDEDERLAFDAVLSEIMTALERDPAAHVYHYAPYEPVAFRRLAARYAWRESEMDVLLRGERFVDLYAIARQSLRAGVERYSIKNLEPFYRFTRSIELVHAGDERRIVERAIELDDLAAIGDDVRAAVAAYNRDDCLSALRLREWLEELRTAAIAAGQTIARPELRTGEASDRVIQRDRWAATLRAHLLEGIDPRATRTPEEQGRWLLAHLVDWHRREERVAWGEYHRLREKSDQELEDEPLALIGLAFTQRVFVPPAAGRARTTIDRYEYPPQENEIRKEDVLRLKNDETLGTVTTIDKAALTIDIRKQLDKTDLHPTTVIAMNVVNAPEQEQAITRVANGVVSTGINDEHGDRLVNDLLLARPPRMRYGPFAPHHDELAPDFAVRIVRNLDESVLPIQGPPGAGKTYTGARMIATLVAEGRNVGVVATGHKVIRKLLVDAAEAARRNQGVIALAHKIGEGDPAGRADDDVLEFKVNSEARAWLRESGGGVLGGTAFMWSRAEFNKAVDVLFVDEAGQMSLANVVAVSQAAHNLVLLGDPQQLEQPQRGAHPDGVDVSALEHLLAGHRTIPSDHGIFLPVTWRLPPAITAFTSEVFYERKLSSRPTLERQKLVGTGRFEGAGLFVVEVPHAGCRNASPEEAEVVASIVEELLSPGASWTDELGTRKLMTLENVLVIAPYNAHVNRLQDSLGRFARRDPRRPADPPPPGVRVGTVDRFQGQEAPVVIYSMATSRPEDAPRGMEFLYSLNRLNVATSRARCACIVVANPRLFEPECRTPRQMQLANALCRYREMAKVIRWSARL